MLCQSCKYAEAENESGDLYYCTALKKTFGIRTKCDSYDGCEFPVDIAIITATLTESEAVANHLLPNGREAWTCWPLNGDRAWSRAEWIVPGASSKRKLRLVTAKTLFQGLPAAAVQATKACQLFNPTYLVMLGITAGRKWKTCLGDVVVPSVIFDYGRGKWIGSEFHASPHQLCIEETVCRNCEVIARDCRRELDEIAAEWPSKAPSDAKLSIRVGQHAVSGAAVVDSKEIWQRILKIDREVAAIDMEAFAVRLAGFQASTTKADVPTVLIAKSVCDYGRQKNDDAQKYAAYTSVRFFRLYVEKFLLETSCGQANLGTMER